jgi:AcrR family transcriptional regulator
VTARKGLTHRAVVDAAIDIVESQGPAGLTMSSVADAVGVKPPSLYNHIDGLRSLERDVALRAVEELGDKLGRAAMGRSGRDAVGALAEALRTYAGDHPGMYALAARARPQDEEFAAASLRAIEPVLAALNAYGLHHADSIHAARMLRAALHGFVSLEQIGGFGLDVDVDSSFAWLVDGLTRALETATTQS